MTAEPEDGASPEPAARVPSKKAKKRRASADPSDKVGAKRSKDGANHRRQRITVEGGGALQLAIPAPLADGQLVLPSSAELELILARAETGEDIAVVERMAAACVDLAKHCDHLKGRLAEFNILRLRSRRRLGLVLMQTDRRGGDRAKWLGATLLEDGLPRGVDPTTGKKCRKLARIPEAAIEEYFRVTVAQGEVPSEAGVIQFAAKLARANGKVPGKSMKTRKPKAEPGASALSAAMLDAVQRCMSNIDVCIGDAKVKCGTHLSADTANTKQIRGKVFVSECRDPGECLSKLAKLQMAGAVEEALVVLPHDTGAAWFKALAECEWSCFFPSGVRDGLLLAYRGERERDFILITSKIGVVMRGCAAAGPVMRPGESATQA